MPNVPSQGWLVAVTHPVTGRTITPQVLSRPQILPSLNSLPEIRIPVAPSASWLDDGFDDDPAMDVWLDGEKQPIDELRRVEDEQGQTILVGVGGVELRDRVTRDYELEERDVAASDVISTDTSYNADVDTPTWDTLADSVLQSADTTAEFNDILSLPSTAPIYTQNGDLRLAQQLFFSEGENFDNGLVSSTQTDANASNSQYVVLFDDGAPHRVSFDFSLDYELPASNFAVNFRGRWGATGERPGIFVEIDGEEIYNVGIDVLQEGGESFSWISPSISDPSSNLAAGSHTVTIGISAETANSENLEIDAVTPYDDRGSFTFDNTVDANNNLDSPRLYAPYEFNFDNATTPWNISEATATGTFDDTTGDQRIQLQLEGGTWLPNDGTEDNTSSVTVSYASTLGSSIRGRVRLDGYGSRDTESPRLGFNGQEIQDWEIKVDVEQEPLLIDQRFDGSAESVLNDIAGSEFIWSYNLDSAGNPQVSWTQPGQRTTADTPELGDVTITKETDTWDKFTIKGANRQIDSEEFTASTSFTGLNRSELVPGSETVFDSSGTNYDRPADYEMRFDTGEIKITDDGALTSGNTYNISYDIEIEGSYTVSGAPAQPVEFVGEAPPVNTDRLAQQIAKTLADDFSGPRWMGNLVIPQAETSFNPLDAFTLENLNLPASATPLEVTSSPEITPEGVRVRLGFGTSLEQSLGDISRQVREVSQRV